MTTIKKKLASGLAALFVLAMLFFLLMPIEQGRESARRAHCANQLRAIGRAMHSYHAAYGSLPPAFIADEFGHPIHSWRMLLLPFMGEQKLYDEYRFDEPWDGPHNAALHDRLKSHAFFCPSSQNPDETSYVAVVGPETAMPGVRSRKMDELQRGPAKTILIVEVLNFGAHWMQPRDLNFDEMCFGVNDPRGRGIASWHSNYSKWPWSKPIGINDPSIVRIAHVLLADGTVRDLPETTSPREVYRLLLIHDEEPLPPR